VCRTSRFSRRIPFANTKLFILSKCINYLNGSLPWKVNIRLRCLIEQLLESIPTHHNLIHKYFFFFHLYLGFLGALFMTEFWIRTVPVLRQVHISHWVINLSRLVADSYEQGTEHRCSGSWWFSFVIIQYQRLYTSNYIWFTTSLIILCNIQGVTERCRQIFCMSSA
jgi:hypothetical protein